MTFDWENPCPQYRQTSIFFVGREPKWAFCLMSESEAISKAPFNPAWPLAGFSTTLPCDAIILCAPLIGHLVVHVAQQWAPKAHTACHGRWALEDRLTITISIILFCERLNGPTFLSQKKQLGCLETTGNAPMALPSSPGRTNGVWRGLPRWWILSQHSISHQHPRPLVRLLKQRQYGKNEVCSHHTHPYFCSGGDGNLKTN